MKINIAGITFGGNKNHWWEGLVPFDDFNGTNGDPVDATKWDTSTTTGATITIQNNECVLYARASYATTDYVDAILTLKNAVKSGRIIALIRYIDFDEYDEITDYFYAYVGNDIDGWTTVINYGTRLTDRYGSSYFNIGTSIECIYQSDNKWNVYIGNNLVSSDLSKPNGMKIKFHNDTARGSSYAADEVRLYTYIDNVYIGD